MASDDSRQPAFGCVQDAPDQLVLALSGCWQVGRPLPAIASLQDRLARPVVTLRFDCRAIGQWDSSLAVFVRSVAALARQCGVACDPAGLPEGLQRLLQLAQTEREESTAARRNGLFFTTGSMAQAAAGQAVDLVAFIGDVVLSLARWVVGRARFRRCDLVQFVYDCGVGALPIVTLISVLIGLVLAFVGAVQLKMFGAQIYVANLVALGMAREMGAMMVGIIVAGRTGAAFASQLGSMQVNEEIDALRTFGISPIDFLVLPRMVALVAMMPLLCVYADALGMLGGALVSATMLDINLLQYAEQTRTAVGFNDLSLGIIKSVVFGAVVAVFGCARGMQCGRSSSAVGDAATSAVVSSIVLIVVTDSLLTVIYSVLGI